MSGFRTEDENLMGRGSFACNASSIVLGKTIYEKDD